MKKLLLMIAIATLAITGYSQSWGAWNQRNCNRGLDYRIKVSSEYASAGKKTVYVDFRNRYQKKIWFSWTVREPGSSKPTTNRTQLGAGRTDGENFGCQLPVNSRVEVFIDNVSFQENGGRPYAECD